MCSIFFHYRLTERQIHGKCGNQIIISSSSLDEHHEVELEDDGKSSSLPEQFVLMIAIQIIHATTLCEKAAIYGTSSVFVLPTHSPIICSVIMFFSPQINQAFKFQDAILNQSTLPETGLLTLTLIVSFQY